MAVGPINYATGYIDLVLRTAQYDREYNRVYLQMIRLATTPWVISLSMSRTQATASLNLYMQQLRAAQTLAQSITLGAGAGGMGGGRRGFGGGGGFGSGFAQGAGGALGMPMYGSPQMMMGQILGRGLVDVVRESVTTFADLESQLVDIQRVAGFSAAEIGRFKNSILGLSTSLKGVKLQDLMEIGQVGAQAGVPDRGGVGGLTQFTADMARVKIVMDKIPTETLSNNILHVLTVFGEGTDRVAGFGSALARMANVSLASSKDILDISERLSGTAAAIGLTIPQVLALSSVLKDVGLPNEVAGSAFSQIFRKMASDSHKFAEEIGIDARIFADAYKRDPMEALELVIKKFQEFKDTIEGQEFLDSLGLKGVRTAGALQQLAAAFDRVKPRTAMAAEETGTQASLEAGVKLNAGKLQSGFDQLGNATTAAKDAIGAKLAPAAGTLATVVSAFALAIRGQNPDWLGGAKAPGAAKPPALPAVSPKLPMPETSEEAEKAVKTAHEDVLARDKDVWRAQALRENVKVMAAQKLLVAAINRRAEAEANLDIVLKKEAAQRGQNLATNLIWGGIDRVLQMAGAVQEGKQAILGAGARAGEKAAGALMPDQKGMTFSSGLSGADVGRQMQDAALNAFKDKNDQAAKETAKNTGTAAATLGEVRDILKNGLRGIGRAVMGP